MVLPSPDNRDSRIGERIIEWGIVKTILLELKRIRDIASHRIFVSAKSEKDIVNAFHELYYNSYVEMGTWKNTYWMGFQLFKCPLDLWIFQEIFFTKQPDVVIECGTSVGASALYFASIFDLLNHGDVITIDIKDQVSDSKNQLSPKNHPRITRLLGSSVSETIIAQVNKLITGKEKIMVILDSDHHYDHVMKELNIYSELVTSGQYLIVEDTNHGHPVQPAHEKPGCPGPMEAVMDFLNINNDFIVDKTKEKFFLTFNPNGYLLKS